MEKRIFESVYQPGRNIEASKSFTGKILLKTSFNGKIDSNIFLDKSTAIKLTKALKKIIATIEE